MVHGDGQFTVFLSEKKKNCTGIVGRKARDYDSILCLRELSDDYVGMLEFFIWFQIYPDVNLDTT